MLSSTCRRALIALTSMVMRLRITAMLPDTTLATSTWAITEGSTAVAGTTKFGFLLDQLANEASCQSIVQNNLKSCALAE